MFQTEKDKKSLKRKGIKVDSFIQSKLFKTPTNLLSSSSIVSAEKSKKEFQIIYDAALIKLLAKQHMSFNQVSGDAWKEFVDFCQLAKKDFTDNCETPNYNFQACRNQSRSSKIHIE